MTGLLDLVRQNQLMPNSEHCWPLGNLFAKYFVRSRDKYMQYYNQCADSNHCDEHTFVVGVVERNIDH
jgi:hypothetical protein